MLSLFHQTTVQSRVRTEGTGLIRMRFHILTSVCPSEDGGVAIARLALPGGITERQLAMALAINLSLADVNDDQSTSWISLEMTQDSDEQEARWTFHLAHLPLRQRQKEGRSQECYIVFSFNAKVSTAQGGRAWRSYSATTEGRLHQARQQTSCDSHSADVIGLAVGLSVAGIPKFACTHEFVCFLQKCFVSGTLFFCTLLLCIAAIAFQQYRISSAGHISFFPLFLSFFFCFFGKNRFIRCC